MSRKHNEREGGFELRATDLYVSVDRQTVDRVRAGVWRVAVIAATAAVGIAVALTQNPLMP